MKRLATFIGLSMVALFDISRADDTALHATINRIIYTHTDLAKVMQAQIRELTEEGFEISWTQPNTERGFIWAKYAPLPWIKLHAKTDPDEDERLRKILKL